MTLDAPFPWFGGKSRVAPLVWSRFGEVANYVEPFFGSGAVLLKRPNWQPGVNWIETVNDADGFVANFWRSLRADPEAVAYHADQPVNECDLHARHSWLLPRRAELTDRLCGDPDYYDAKIAGWWVWGQSVWIGSNWCSGVGPWQSVDGKLVKAEAGGESGAKRQIPHLGDAGTGVKRQSRADGLTAWLTCLADRLAGVRVCCGDWTRVMGPSVTIKHGLTAVLLDPPYSHAERHSQIYSHESDCAVAVQAWCREHGSDPLLRIAICGYAGEGHEALEADGWEVVAWKANGGYGNKGNKRGRDNAHRERIWFSPACQAAAQAALPLELP